jgi:hypothetical protein
MSATLEPAQVSLRPPSHKWAVKIGSISAPHNARLVTRALDAGYRLLFTTDPELADPESSAPRIGRIAVEPLDRPLEFRLKALGVYRWLARKNKSSASDH